MSTILALNDVRALGISRNMMRIVALPAAATLPLGGLATHELRVGLFTCCKQEIPSFLQCLLQPIEIGRAQLQHAFFHSDAAQLLVRLQRREFQGNQEVLGFKQSIVRCSGIANGLRGL